jgi:hypothetical protein
LSHKLRSGLVDEIAVLDPHAAVRDCVSD